jgi:hypothetical protein
MALSMNSGLFTEFELQEDLYFGSQAVKRGFYTLFAWESFELFFEYPDDLKEISRIILSDEH